MFLQRRDEIFAFSGKIYVKRRYKKITEFMFNKKKKEYHPKQKDYLNRQSDYKIAMKS